MVFTWWKNHHALSKPLFKKKRFGTSPEKHCLIAMPYRLFQGNLNPKDLN